MINAKKKGNRGENILNGMDYSMEIKTVKKLNLKEAWKQVNRDASIAHNSPLLAVHFDGMPEKEWIVCISSADWIEIEKELRQVSTKDKTVDYKELNSNKELSWLLIQLKNLISKIIKLLQ